MAYIESLSNFLVGLLVSGVIIYLVTSFLGKKRRVRTAFLAALTGSIIYSLVPMFMGSGLMATLIAGFAWLMAIRRFYSAGWLKALLMAFVIWAVTNIVSVYLPTVTGSL